MTKQQPIGQTLLQLLGAIVIGIITIAGIVIAWVIKTVGIVLMKVGEFILLKLTNK